MKQRKIKNSKYFIKITGVFIGICLLFGGCGSFSKKNIIDNNKINIITTVFPVYDFVRQIGGDYVNASLLLPPGVESHSYEPTPADIINISQSDGFIYVGGESDTWINSLLGGTLQDVRTLKIMDCVDVLEEQSVNETDSVSTGEAEYDEHVWTSIKNAILITEKITDMLCEIDNQHSNYYRQNADDYIQKLKELDQKFKTVVANGNRNTLVFGDRFPFRYFVEEYGLKYYAAFPGCSGETEPSAAMLASLVNKIKGEHIPVVLYLELSNHKIADALAETCGVKTAMFHSCHNVSKEEMDAGVTYISIMENNIEVLKEALQ